MRIIELATSNVAVYIRETPRELPINRYTDYQKYLIQAAGIGSTVGEVERHFNKLYSFLSSGQVENAARESQNLLYNIHLNINKIDIDSFAFLCLVDSVQERGKDPEKIRDFSEAGLLRLCERLGGYGLTKGQVLEILGEVKKKSIED
jgi:hypothetical protein